MIVGLDRTGDKAPHDCLSSDAVGLQLCDPFQKRLHLVILIQLFLYASRVPGGFDLGNVGMEGWNAGLRMITNKPLCSPVGQGGEQRDMELLLHVV